MARTATKSHRTTSARTARGHTPKLQAHPLADRFPAMTEGELAALEASMRAIGQKDPIILLGGKILDGRHRYLLCQKLGLTPKTVNFDPRWGDPVEYVLASAAHRNMTLGQKACAAEAFMDDLVKTRKPGPKSGTNVGTELLKSSEYAALRFGVSRSHVELVRKIRRDAREVYSEIFAGKINVTQGATRLKHRSREKQVRQLRESAHVTIKDCDLLCGDNVELLAPMKSFSVQTIFADPPYNNGWPYDADPTKDNVNPNSYFQHLLSVMVEATRLLTSGGSLFVLIDDANSDRLGMSLRTLGLVRQPTIVWVETFGTYNAAENGLSRGCRYLHWYTKTVAPLINVVEPRIDSWRKLNGDTRAQEHGRMPDNVWQIPRVTSQSRERCPWLGQTKQPPQLPLDLPRRCILLTSNPGDTVLDPYNGNGITGVAALTESRKYIGLDRSAKYIEQARRWIHSEFQRITAERSK